MQNKHYLLLSLFFLYFFSSCNKQSPLSTPVGSGDSTLDAKMAAYGFKPYTGPLDSVASLKPMTFEQFATKMTALNQALKAQVITGRGRVTQSTNGADIDTSADGIQAEDDITFTWYNQMPVILNFSYPLLENYGFPYNYTLTLSAMSANVVTSSMSPGSSSYEHNDGINQSADFYDPTYTVEGFLTLTFAITNSNGTTSYYSIHYYVSNYIFGQGEDDTFYLTSVITLTKAD